MCVRRRGESIVDFTWSSPSDARDVTGWEMARDIETLSDHLYISVKIASHLGRHRSGHSRPRWALKKLNEDAIMALVTSAMWSRDSLIEGTEEEDPVQDTEWLRGVLTCACDAAMPRAKL